MFVLTVIPITNRPLPGSLTYYSDIASQRGAVIEVPLGNAQVYGIVVASETLRAARGKIRKAEYTIRKLTQPQMLVHFSETFLGALMATARTYLCPPSHLAHALLPDSLLQHLLASGSLQAKHIHIYPTWREATFASKFVHSNAAILHTTLTKKQQERMLQKDHGELVTTPSFAWAYLLHGATATIHQADSEHYYRPRKPWFDYAAFLQSLGVALGTSVTLSKSLATLDSAAISLIQAPLNDKLGYAIVLHPNILLHIKKLVDAGEKVLVLSPRSGFATGVRCRDCGTVAHDERTGDRYRLEEVAPGEFYYTTTHSRTTAGHTCQKCQGTNIAMFGFGTDAFDKILSRNFGAVPYFRVEASTGKRALTQAEQAPHGLVLGTWSAAAHLAPQSYHSVVLGLEFLMGIPGAYQLEYVLRRLARLQSSSKTLAVSQHDAKHPLVNALAAGTWQSLVSLEEAMRQQLGYPPHGKAVVIRSVIHRGGGAPIRTALQQVLQGKAWVWHTKPSKVHSEELTITCTAKHEDELVSMIESIRRHLPKADLQLHPRSL